MLVLKSKLVNLFKRKKVANVHFTVDLNEITEEKFLEIQQAIGTFGYITFTPDKLKKQVEEVMKNRKIGIRPDGFSHSQVLRGQLRKLWELVDYEGTFESYYDLKMNQIINHFETKITNAKSSHFQD